MEYTKIIKDLRISKNLLQEDIANVLGIARQTYNHYEVEEKVIPIKHLITLSNFYNVSLDYLLGLSNIKNYNKLNNDVTPLMAGKRLEEFRKNKKISKSQLARLINSTHSYIAWCEHGRYLLSTQFLYAIAKEYNISVDYLVGKIDEEKSIDFK